MRALLLLPTLLSLAGCATQPGGIGAPMHDAGDNQLGWEERKADDGNPLFVVRSAGAASYASLVKVAEQHASQRCPYGYRVIAVGGADQPDMDVLNPRLIIGAELRFEVHCFERDNF